MARQPTRELMSTTHTNSLLIPIITWCVRLFCKNNNNQYSGISAANFDKSAVKPQPFCFEKQLFPLLDYSPDGTSSSHCQTKFKYEYTGWRCEHFVSIELCDPCGCKLFVSFHTECNDNSQHSTIYFATEYYEINHSCYVQCSIWNCSRTTTPISTWILRLKMLPQNLAWTKVYVKHWIVIGSKGDTRK